MNVTLALLHSAKTCHSVWLHGFDSVDMLTVGACT